MAVKPIIFRGPMVRAILDGRKTQFRLVVKLGLHTPAPYAVGDILYVREGFALVCTDDPPHDDDSPFRIEYRADTDAKYPGGWPDDMGDDPECGRWRSPVTMPKRAARIWRKVTGVRVKQDSGVWSWIFDHEETEKPEDAT